MNVHVVPPPSGASPEDRLAAAVEALRAWQRRQDRLGAGRHGRCLEAVRAALASLGLTLPPPQPRPRNLALANYGLLRQDPARWGWAPAPGGARYTLDYFDHVGRLPDGRVAGHIAVTDHQAGVLYSSWDYALSPYWKANRAGSFVPLFDRLGAKTGTGGGGPAPEAPQGEEARLASSVARATPSPYLDTEVVDAVTGGVLRRLPACALLASDGHAYLRATALAEAVGEPYAVGDAHREGVLVLRRGGPVTER